MPKIDIQPKDITEARYHFTALQKDIIYEMIGHLQPLMSKDIVKLHELSRETLKVSIKVSELAGKNNHEKVIKQAEGLMDKKFRYKYDKGSKKHLKITTLIHDIDHEYYSDTVTLEISPGAVPVLLYIGEGFTQYQKAIALTLKSVHSKRMYELCCSWRKEGGFQWSLDRFRKTFGLEKKYPNPKDLKARVLEVAKKELKEKADVWFEYSLPRKRKGQEQMLTVKIFSNSEVVKQQGLRGEESEKYSFVWRFLQHAFPATQSDKFARIADELREAGELDRAYERFSRLDDELTEGKKKKSDLGKLIRHILKEDYNIK